MPISRRLAQRIESDLVGTGICIIDLRGTAITTSDLQEAVQRIGIRRRREVSIATTPSGALVTVVFPDWPATDQEQAADTTGHPRAAGAVRATDYLR